MRVVLVVAVLVGCAPPKPVVIAGTPRSVTLGNVEQDNISNAVTVAQLYCAQYGPDAEYVPDGNATYKCVNRMH